VRPAFSVYAARSNNRSLRTQEILHYDPDVACLQEVDKIEHHGPILEEAGYSYKYTTGYPTKLHGLCVIWKRDLLELVGEKIVKLDDASFDLAVEESSSPRTGCSRATRNIGLLTALRFRGQQSEEGTQGVILVTRE
jgi:RNA exonuclease NGL2